MELLLVRAVGSRRSTLHRSSNLRTGKFEESGILQFHTHEPTHSAAPNVQISQDLGIEAYRNGATWLFRMTRTWPRMK